MPQVQFAAGAYQSRNTALDAQRCVNFFSEQAPNKDAEALVGVFGCPGLTQWSSVLRGQLPVRAFRIMNGVTYAVIGGSLYSLAADGTSTLLSGALMIGGSDPVSISDNGVQIVLVNGQAGYVYQPGGLYQTLASQADAGATSLTVQNITGTINPGDPVVITLDSGTTFATTASGAGANNVIPLSNPLPSTAGSGNTAVTPANCFAQINHPAFYAATTITFLDGYFLFNRAGTKQCFFSALYDGTLYNGLDFLSKESNSDELRAVANLHQTLVMVGERTTELAQDTGANDEPFQLIGGAVIQRGTAAPLSVLVEDNTLFMIGNDVVFYRLDAYKPVRLSTHTVETAWTGYGDISNAFCFVVVWEGHKFIIVQFPSADATWAYDIATGLWHERDSYINGSFGRWRGNCAIQAFGVVLIGDAFNGGIGTWDYDAFTEYGNQIRGLLTSPPIHKDRKRVFISLFETYWETGVGNAAAPNPYVTLDWSDDGARTWSDRRLSGYLGQAGAYRQRTRWLRLGQARTRTFRLRVMDPVRRNLVGAYLESKVGM